MDTTIVVGILTAYLTVLIAIGLYSSRKVKSSKGFFLADRSLGWFPITATITVTTVGGSATIAAGALIYKDGLPGLWLDIGGAIGLVVLGLTLAKMVRKTKLVTLPDIAGKLFDEKVRYASAILIIITEIAWVSLLIQGSGLILDVLLPIDYEILLVIITAAFVAYTLVGGQYAVVYTDVIQFFVMIIGLCFIAAPLLLIDALPSFDQLPAASLSFPVNSNIGVLSVGSFFFMMLMPHIVGPDIYSKLLSAKDEKTARRGAIFSGIFKFIFAIAIGIIALSAIVLHPGLGDPSLAIPTAVFGLPPILAGLIFAAFISVMLSSADSCLLSAGTILSVDIFRKKEFKKIGTLGISRIGMLMVGICALILALYYTKLGGILDTLKFAYTVFTAGFTLPIIFGFYKEKTHVTSTGALWSLILGGFTSLIWLNFIPVTYHPEYAVLVGLAVSIIPLLIFRDKNMSRKTPLKQ